MQICRTLLLYFFLCLTLSSCEKADPYVQKLKRALSREKTPKQVVGLPHNEKIGVLPPPPEPVKMEPVINKKARVAILAYNDFSESRNPTQMLINIKEFRSQMQEIKDADIPVISMRQFLDWKQGKKDIPAESIMITIDDGWQDTHTLAMPVLKEFGFPFTAFLYQKYVGVGGRSMTHSQIRELIEAGGTVCSHSVSLINMTRPPGRTSEEKTEWIKAELRDSHDFLEQHFSEGVVKTFAFPYGFHNEQILELAKETGYEACFTVTPGKTTWESNDFTLNRYVIHGNAPSTFDAAINFGGGTNSPSQGSKLITEQRDKASGAIKGPLIEVYPPRGSILKNRLPRIEIKLAALDKIQPESMGMRISGLGKVPHSFDPQSKTVFYQVPLRLRLDKCSVQFSFRHGGNREIETINWSFSIDKVSEYLSPKTTFLRPLSQPNDSALDLVQRNPVPPQESGIRNQESGGGVPPLSAGKVPQVEIKPAETSAADLISPANTIN